MRNKTEDPGKGSELFDRIYRNYHSHLEYIAYDILKNKQDAEDALQEALLSIYEHISFLEGLEDFRIHYYVIRVVKNKAVDILRKRRQTIPFEDYEYADPGARESTSGDERIDLLTSCIRQLPALYRDVLGLYYVTGLSSAEIAQTLGRSDAAVRKQLQRGRELLKNRFESAQREEYRNEG